MPKKPAPAQALPAKAANAKPAAEHRRRRATTSFWSMARPTSSAPITRCRRSTANPTACRSMPCSASATCCGSCCATCRPRKSRHIWRSSSTSPKSRFATKLYPDYKAHRPPAPDDLIPQFALIREAVKRLRPALPRAERLRGRRPDRHLRSRSLRTRRDRTIVSSDKDLMQLVTDASRCTTR
jgi:hypothetical protein